MKSSLAELQPWISNAVVTSDGAFDGVSTDSRSVSSGNLVVALRGERFDAHAFLAGVAAQGAAAVVVDHVPKGLRLPAMVVPDTRIALGEIARHWRERFSIPVIGVTGSNGKTTVKEMIASILAAAFGNGQFLATRGNLNNEIGVPLTLLRLDASCRAAVIELGMNHPGEIAVLAQIAQPTVGLVNNAQREHQEFMASVEAVAQENGAVIRALPAGGIAVFPADDPFAPLWRTYANDKSDRRIVTFGLSADADVHCSYLSNVLGSDLQVSACGQQFALRLSAVGTHNVRNALAAIACTVAIGIDTKAIRHGLEAFTPVNGRLQRKTAACGALLIDDTYNANPDSVRAAIDVLAQAPAPRVLVLGDMGEVGADGLRFHEEIGAYAKARGIEYLLTLGELATHAAEAFGERGRHFGDIDTINRAIEAILTPMATVLVKGSRFMKMERVVQHLLGQSLQESH
ncbi:MAG TPA: UDP-N-acetylmuramoyl-tripeptide--D-alanyl-D-alanine ligase [Burkholderiaceae bacterium]|nr:UDP-N-acetylmuramoyl-tripeptide--D-alanyl-D-alanine ligase [Burkholderiaceae bacterium]